MGDDRSGMEFRVLGPFEVHNGGEAIPIGAFRQRAVLALLTIHPGEVLSTDRIIDEIWAGSPPPSALKTLHAYVSRLRRALHDSTDGDGSGELIVSRSPGYALAIDPSQIDAVCFEAMVVDASDALASGRSESAADGLREAMSLWRGTALADFAYESFAVTESQRLMARRMEAVELRIDADLALARHASLVAELEGLVAEHPLRERLWAQLMTALYRCGRQAEALAAYGRVRHALVEDLGIEPGPELRRLERQVLEQSHELAWQPVAGRPGPTGTTVPITMVGPGADPLRSGGDDIVRHPRRAVVDSLPLVGRDGHLDRLAQLVRSARPEDTPRLALVVGEAGCGKSRLLAEFGRLTSTDDVLVATGSAERESSIPYGPFADIVRCILDATGATALERVGHLRADLTWLIPELGPRPSMPDGDLGLARTRLFEAVHQLLAGAGDAQPLVLFVDDAHQLGDGSASLLRTLLDRRWARPVVIVLAVRTGPGDRPSTIGGPLLEMFRHEGATTLEVGRLLEADLATLVGSLGVELPGQDIESVAAHLSEQTGGIPLLVREVLAASTLTEGSGLELGKPHGLVSPVTGAVIGHRLHQLSPDAQRLLGVAAVVGMDFPVDVLAEIADEPPVRVSELLEEAFQAGIVVGAEDPNTFAFDHGLIREVAAGSVSAGRQIRLHGRLAGLLTERGLDVEAARHGLLGYSDVSAADAVQMALRGADNALQALDFEVARALCAEALAGPARGLGPGAQADLLARIARAQSLMGRPGEAEQAWAQAADLARAAGDDVRLAQIAIGTELLGRVHTGLSELRWSLLTEALERTGPDWSRLRLLVASEWLIEAAMPSRRAVSTEFVDEVVGAAIALGDLPALAAAYHTRHVLARARQMPERRQWSDELVQVAETIGAGEWLFEGYLARLIDAAGEADGPGMDGALDQLRQTCAGYRAPRALWLFELAAATCARLRGQFALADEHSAAASTIGERFGIPDTVAAVGAGAVIDTFHRGGLRSLRTVLADFAALIPDVAAWTFAAGLAAADDGDPVAAGEALARGMDRLPDEPEEVWLTGLCLGSELVGQVGADDRTISRLSRLLSPHAGRIAVVGTLSSEFGPTDRCLGLLNAAQGDPDRAADHFASAVRACQRLGARPWELRTRADWMVVDQAVGHPERPWWGTIESEIEAMGLGGAMDRLHRDSCAS